jgi:hypothetical protein
MTGILCFALLALLAIRSLILAVAERKPVIIRLFDLLLAFMFGAATGVLFFFVDWREAQNPAVLLIFLPAAVIVLSLRWRLRRPYESRPVALLFKILFVLLLALVSVLVLMTAGFIHLIEDQPLLKVTMTGNHEKQLVEWKNPEGTLQKENLEAYQVLFDTSVDKRVADLYIYGDQVAVKAKVIRFRPVLNLLGLRNLCRIEYIYNGYTSAERFNQYPHYAMKIPSPYPALSAFQERFWGLWEREYYQKVDTRWIKSATLESTYFPLVNPDGTPFHGSYYLTITSGGLSGVPLP